MNNKVKNIVFDFGGVVVTLDHNEAVRRFAALGLENAAEQLNPYTQGGIFGELELGNISAEVFIEKLSGLCHRQLSYDECLHAWLGYRKELPQRNLDAIVRLREEGHRVILLSNTNPFMMQWAESPEFDGHGHPISYYFDHLYLSYECKVMKPSPAIFHMMLAGEQARPEETLFVDDGRANVEAAARLGIRTLCPQNNEDWTGMLLSALEDR